MSSILKVDTIQDQDGNNIINENANTVTVGKSGDTVNIVGTLQNNGAAIPGDISSVVAGTGLSGGGTTGDVTLNIEAAQPTITSTGTLAGFTSTGIDDNATSTAITIGSNENIGIGTTNSTLAKVYISHAGDADDNGLYIESNLSQTVPLVKIIQDGAASTAPAVYVRNDDADGIALHLEKGDSGVTPATFANSLFIEDDANTGLTIGTPTNGVGSIAFGDSGDNDIGKIQYQHSDNSMLFVVNGSERGRFTSGGDFIMLRTTPPSASNSGWGVIKDGAANMQAKSSSSSTASYSHYIFFNPNGQVGSISTGGTSTAYTTSSDYRLKENVVEITNATDRLKQLQPKRFNFIADADTIVDGFIAHEVSSVVPEAITGTKDAVNEDGTPDYQGIDQSKLVPLLVKTIQELEARITALETTTP